MAFGSVNVPGAGHLALLARLESLEGALAGGATLSGPSDPTAATTAQVGQVYVNTTTGEEWVCTAVAENGDATWIKRLSQVFVVGASAPERTEVLWIDTTPETGGLKYHNGTAWVHVPTAAV